MIAVASQKNKIHPHKFALWVAMASIIMMFAGLTSAYIVKSGQAGWEQVQLPKAFIYSTIIMLASSVTIQIALRAFKQREMNKYRSFLLISALLGVVFVLLQYIGFNWMWTHGVRFSGSGAGQFLYIIAGLHGLHVLGGVIALFVIWFRSRMGKTRIYSSVPIEVGSLYWHFVDALWLYLLIFFAVIG